MSRLRSSREQKSETEPRAEAELLEECCVCLDVLATETYHGEHKFCNTCIEIIRFDNLPCPKCRWIDPTVPPPSRAGPSRRHRTVRHSGLVTYYAVNMTNSPHHYEVEVEGISVNIYNLADGRKVFFFFLDGNSIDITVDADFDILLVRLEPYDPLVHLHEQQMYSQILTVCGIYLFGQGHHWFQNPEILSQINGNNGSESNTDHVKEEDELLQLMHCAYGELCSEIDHFHQKPNKPLTGAIRRKNEKEKIRKKKLIEGMLKNVSYCRHGCEKMADHLHLQRIRLPPSLLSHALDYAQRCSNTYKPVLTTAPYKERGELVNLQKDVENDTEEEYETETVGSDDTATCEDCDYEESQIPTVEETCEFIKKADQQEQSYQQIAESLDLPYWGGDLGKPIKLTTSDHLSEQQNENKKYNIAQQKQKDKMVSDAKIDQIMHQNPYEP
jgi:hypothetical protein